MGSRCAIGLLRKQLLGDGALAQAYPVSTSGTTKAVYSGVETHRKGHGMDCNQATRISNGDNGSVVNGTAATLVNGRANGVVAKPTNGRAVCEAAAKLAQRAANLDARHQPSTNFFQTSPFGQQGHRVVRRWCRNQCGRHRPRSQTIEPYLEVIESGDGAL